MVFIRVLNMLVTPISRPTSTKKPRNSARKMKTSLSTARLIPSGRSDFLKVCRLFVDEEKVHDREMLRKILRKIGRHRKRMKYRMGMNPLITCMKNFFHTVIRISVIQ